jgi:hypothetical protein
MEGREGVGEPCFFFCTNVTDRLIVSFKAKMDVALPVTGARLGDVNTTKKIARRTTYSKRKTHTYRVSSAKSPKEAAAENPEE